MNSSQRSEKCVWFFLGTGPLLPSVFESGCSKKSVEIENRKCTPALAKVSSAILQVLVMSLYLRAHIEGTSILAL